MSKLRTCVEDIREELNAATKLRDTVKRTSSDADEQCDITAGNSNAWLCNCRRCKPVSG